MSEEIEESEDSVFHQLQLADADTCLEKSNTAARIRLIMLTPAALQALTLEDLDAAYTLLRNALERRREETGVDE